MDADQFKRLLLPLHPQLYRIAFRLTRNSSDAQDLVQETYLKMWSSRERLDSVDNPQAFAVTTLRNLFVDSVRRRPQDSPSALTADELPLASDIDIGRQVESADALDKVVILIDRLPATQREVMKMRDLADLSFEDIEAATGLSPGNIRTLLSRARKKIKEQYLSLVK